MTPQVLVFVSTKAAAEELARSLTAHTPHRVEAIHGDRTQAERQDILLKFKRGATPILVATDVASRGLDIPAIKTVVNYDVAKKIEDHTHRIGRTGRAGATDGSAYTSNPNPNPKPSPSTDPNPSPDPIPNPNQVSSAIGTSKKDPVHADGTPLGVLVDFDNGETHP